MSSQSWATKLPNPDLTLPEKYADILINSYGAQNVQYALIKDGKFVVSGARGINDKKNHTQITTENIYPIASISKIYTTAAIMNLVEEGKINLDEPIITYMPDFKMKDERYKNITPRMLLNHSSGLMATNLENAFLYDIDTTNHDILLNVLQNQRLNANPGEFSVFCNEGFSLAEILIERVSGLSFTEYINKYITEPLELDITTTPQDDFNMDIIANLSVPIGYFGYAALGAKAEVINALGTAGIYTNAQELCLFAEIFLDEGILTQESIDLTGSAQYLEGMWHDNGKSIIEYGLGWDNGALSPFNEQGIKVLSIAGDSAHSHASLLVVPQYDIAVAVLSTGGFSSGSIINLSMASQLLLDELIKDGAMQPPTLPQRIVPTNPIEVPDKYLKYNGFYINDSLECKIDIDKHGILKITLPNLPYFPSQKLWYQGNGIFIDPTGNAQFEFVEEENGHTYLKSTYLIDAGFFPLTNTGYQYQKLEPISISDKIENVWKNRLGKKYYMLDIPYNGLTYAYQLPNIIMPSQMPVKGYFDRWKILDNNNVISVLQIPQAYGRDAEDAQFYIQDGIEYMKSNKGLYVEEEAVKPLADGTYTIADNGYAQYFKSSDKDKSLSVTIDGAGILAVYNNSYGCVYSSMLEDARTVELPADATVVIAGDAGTTFNITVN
ncbi:hypothetical protein AN641_03850 [Candidatus Epulonipiscioides gigas]|nr:hypothetical protein AN641_03850 [Epulopiscium sp. SCG-C07WGA-EpuloA2]